MSELPELGPVVEVEWVDSAAHGEWATPDEVHALLDKLTCRSVGYLLHDDERGVLLALGAGAVGQYLSTMAIPRAAILDIRHLRDGPA